MSAPVESRRLTRREGRLASVAGWNGTGKVLPAHRFDSTRVVWTTEFGPTPFNYTLENPACEHHGRAFSSWLAGAGIK